MRQSRDDVFCHQRRVKFILHVGQQDGEFVAAEARDQVGLAYLLAYTQRDLADQFVAVIVTQRVVYRFETVHYAVVLAILTFSVYNGARYYVQVFSRIYEKRYKDEQLPEAEYVDTSAVMTEHVKKD